MHRWPKALDSRLIDDWHHQAIRSWSVRVALFWGAVGGLIMVWPAFAGVIPIGYYAAIGVALNCAFVGAKFLKQPGADS